jgi:Arabinose efflux permease
MTIPSLSVHLKATTSQLQWSVDSYALAFASTLIFMGAIADRYGRKFAFIIGLVLFGLSSALAAFAGSMEVLISARTFMGLGGALIMPSTLAILKDVFPPEERPKAMGIWVGVSSLGIPLGPLVGGFLLSTFWWGSVFLVNVPIIVIAMIGAIILIPESRNRNHPGLDLLGLFTSILGALFVVDAIIEAPVRGWLSPWTICLFLFGIVTILWFLRRDSRAEFPVLGEAAFHNHHFYVPLITIASLFFTVFGSLFLLTIRMQSELSMSPILAGLHIMPLCAAALMAPIAPRLVHRYGLGKISSIGPLLSVFSMIILVATDSPGSFAIVSAMTILGIGIGIGAPTSVDAILEATPADQSGAGSAVADVAMQGGGALGIAVMGSLMATSAATGWTGYLSGAIVSAIGTLLVRCLLRENNESYVV